MHVRVGACVGARVAVAEPYVACGCIHCVWVRARARERYKSLPEALNQCPREEFRARMRSSQPIRCEGRVLTADGL